MADVLSHGELKRLTAHKYSATGTSLLEPWMQHFWRWLVEQIPLWWAPNAITLVGLLINIATTLLIMMYSPDAKQEIPGWTLFLAALGLWVYQSLDAIDGKQARRTNSASPLGELFDHGCDSVSSVFVAIGTCTAVQLGDQPHWFLFECFAGMFLFYLAHWQTYCSGTLKFGIIDVTEAQYSIILIYVISGIFGTSIWSTQLPLLGIQLKMLPVGFSIFTAVLACKMNFDIIFIQGGMGRHGSTIADTSVLSPVVPIGSILGLGYYVWRYSSTQVFHQHPILFVLSMGLPCAKVTNRLVVAHMSKSEITLFDSSLFGPLTLFLNQYLNLWINEYLVLWICFIYSTADLLIYSINVCRSICDYMEIHCFSITNTSNQNKQGESQVGSPSKQLPKASNAPQQSTNGVDYVKPVTRASSRLSGGRK